MNAEEPDVVTVMANLFQNGTGFASLPGVREWVRDQVEMYQQPNKGRGMSDVAPDEPEVGQDPLSREVPLADVRPSPENDKLYRPIDPNDPDLKALAESIRDFGLKDPVRITVDRYILSGHRRYAACKLLGLATIPVVVEPITRVIRDDGGRPAINPEFARLLAECNRQRVKSADEQAREECLFIDPEDAYQVLLDHRKKAAAVNLDAIDLGAAKKRKAITTAKWPMLDAIRALLHDLRDFLPLTDRQIHYGLLNDPPLIHASKPGSRYRNDLASYKALCELVTRARLAGLIPFEAIHDPTRPQVVWGFHRDTGTFLRRELDGFLKGYQRDLLQSQPNLIHVVGEKNTIEGIIRPVCGEYGVGYTIGRGYSSLPPRHDLYKRFTRSGKEKLLLLVLSDFDPEGEDIARAYAASMRDDFGVASVEATKVCLTAAQVRTMSLHPQPVKERSSRSGKFIEKHGRDVYEMEAVPPVRLQQLLREAIEGVLDLDAFNREVAREKEEAVKLEAIRRRLSTGIVELLGGESGT